MMLIEHPAGYQSAGADAFLADVQDATGKFEHLIRKGHAELRNVHERIALEESEAVAAQITELPLATPTAKPPVAPATAPTVTTESQSSALEKIKNVNDIVEMGITWGGRLVQFGPWILEVGKLLG